MPQKRTNRADAEHIKVNVKIPIDLWEAVTIEKARSRRPIQEIVADALRRRYPATAAGKN